MKYYLFTIDNCEGAKLHGEYDSLKQMKPKLDNLIEEYDTKEVMIIRGTELSVEKKWSVKEWGK